MTVAELITKLQEMPQDSEVMTYDQEYSDLNNVGLVGKGIYGGKRVVALVEYESDFEFARHFELDEGE